jgi:hypothetical protein
MALTSGVTPMASLMDPLLAIYLRGGWEPWCAPVNGTESTDLRAHLQGAAQALLAESRLGVAQMGEQGFLVNRVGWFIRFLGLLPASVSDPWVASQVKVMERQAIAALEAHERLLPLLFDTALAPEERTQAQALWLAIVATGSIWLDDQRRSVELAEARRLLALSRVGPPVAHSAKPSPH